MRSVATLLMVAAMQTATAEDASLDARTRQLATELRCLVCANQTLAESHAALAVDLRARIRTMLADGADEAQVRAFLAERYGDQVSYRPPLRAGTLALWFGPPLLLAGGAAAGVLWLRRRARLPAERFEPSATFAEDPA